MKITAFIVEDISHSIKTLEILLQKYDEIELVGFATNAEEAIEKIKVLKPDVLFMDIKLGKDSGFTVLDQTKGFYKFVIFTTAYSEYSLSAFHYQTLHYLLKPIDIDMLDKAVDKVINFFEATSNTVNPYDEINKLNLILNNKNGKTIFVPEKNSWLAINTDQILYVKAEASYSYINTLVKNIKVSKNLSAMEKMLEGQDHFFRVHRSYIINTLYIKSLKKGNDSSIELINGENIPISQNEKNVFFTKLGVKQDQDEL
jgi:two-component system LytT family response regulator